MLSLEEFSRRRREVLKSASGFGLTAIARKLEPY